MALSLNDHVKYIKKLPVFDEMDEKDIAEMLKQEEIIRIVSYEPGEKIITEKRFDRKIFLMIKGIVKITKDVISGNSRESKHIKTIEGNGHFLGEVTAITGKPRTASVTAADETVCVVIDFALLTAASSILYERVRNKFYPKLFELLCHRLEETNEYFVILKKQIEDLEKRVMQIMTEKFQLKHELLDELQKKNREIKRLEAQIDEIKSL
jgi:CRP-like cAMP-binding protein